MELVAPWLLARMIPCVNRALGRRAALMSDGYFAKSVFCFDMRILKPAEDFPKDPVTATTSPGRAPSLRTSSFGFASPTPTMSITRSSRSEEHTSELQSQSNLVCRLLLEKKKKKKNTSTVVHQ